MRGTAALSVFLSKKKRGRERRKEIDKGKEVARNKEYKYVSLTKRIVHCRLLGSCYCIVI